MARILIVDDENDIAELISDVLVDEGFETVIRNNGNDAIALIESESFDLILLDVMMPGMSGIELCTRVRTTVECPIIFITAKNQIIDKLIGFEIGVDDYITKPFINEELVARVKAHIRRSDRETPKAIRNVIKIGEIEINIDSYEVFKNEKQVEISTREFELLVYLMKNAGIALSKEQIFESVWGINYNEMGTVAVYIKSLRDKLDQDEKYIRTVWGFGYKFIKVVD